MGGSEDIWTPGKGKIHRLALVNETNGLSCSILHVLNGFQVSGQTFLFVCVPSLATGQADGETGSESSERNCSKILSFA